MFFQFLFIAGLAALFINNSRPNNSNDQASYIGNIGKPVSVDEVATMKVATNVAKKSELVVANNVVNFSDTVRARDEFVSESSQYLSAPTIVETNTRTIEDLTTHKVGKDESIEDIAAQYDVKTQTIRWANDLITDVLPVGRELTIPPVDGVYYELEEDQKVDDIAKEYEANKTRILVFNDLNNENIEAGTKLMVPDGKKDDPAKDESSTTNNLVSTVAAGSSSYTPTYGGYNGYAFGNCTWHAADRRGAVGKPIPNNLGNAATWASLSASAGFGVSSTPTQYSVIYHKDIWSNGGYGHVAFVEAVNNDGSITVSDMNNYATPGGGFNRVSFRTVTPSEFGAYLFIH